MIFHKYELIWIGETNRSCKMACEKKFLCVPVQMQKKNTQGSLKTATPLFGDCQQKGGRPFSVPPGGTVAGKKQTGSPGKKLEKNRSEKKVEVQKKNGKKSTRSSNLEDNC